MAADGTYVYSTRARILGGMAAGVIAGIVMAMVAMINAASSGLEFFFPVKQIAATLFGVEALISGAGVILVGILLHMAVSAGWGMLFGLLVGHRLNAAAAMAAGLVFGVLQWGIMTWLVLPWANEVMLDRVMVISTWWFVYHLVYGAMLFLTPRLVRAFASGEDERPAPADAEFRTRRA